MQYIPMSRQLKKNIVKDLELNMIPVKSPHNSKELQHIVIFFSKIANDKVNTYCK